jgi:hypothetical protein
MLETQKKLIGCCEELSGKIEPANLSGQITEKIASIAEEMKNRDLLLPVVGAFSSGKSSLINAILDADVLSVVVTPETSLATEMRFSGEERIEAVRDDGTIDRYGPGEMKNVSDKAADYVYARFYLNNGRLREIEPLVLVDMPGFDSPLDAHNKAIFAYLDRGCHYIVLASVEEGTVTKSLMRRLREIDGPGRSFSFFLTKADLKTMETVDELIAYFKEELKDAFGYEGVVVSLDNQSADAVLSVLRNTDPDKIFFGLYRERLKDLCYEIIDTLNIKIGAAKKDSDALRAAAEELRGSLEKLKKKADADTETMRRTYSGATANDIADGVGRALQSALEELVSLAMSGNRDELAQMLNEIVRSELLVSAKNKLDDINRRIVLDFSHSLQGLGDAMKDLGVSGDYMRDLTERMIRTMSEGLQTVAASPNAPKMSAGLNFGYKAMTGVAVQTGFGLASFAGAFASVAVPVIGVIVAFLPEIIGIFTRDARKRQQEETVRNKLLGEVFPGIKRKIRAEISRHLEEQVDATIARVRALYEEEINAKGAEIDAAAAEKSAGVQNADETRALCEGIRADVQTIARKINEGTV